MPQRTEITFETEETIRLRARRSHANKFCPSCRDLVDMATPRAIAILAGVSERTIFRLIEDGKVHFVEDEGIYVCLNSLIGHQGRVKQ